MAAPYSDRQVACYDSERRTTMFRRILKLGAIALALAGVLLATRAAWARHGRGFHRGMFRGMVGAHVDEALDAARATPAQRDAIHAARDHVFATMEESHRGRDFEKVLKLFEAERLDPAELGRLRGEHE